jgi:hypothetical protein
MPAAHDNYTQADLESAKRNLSDILTVTPQEAGSLLRGHPNEVTQLARTFTSAKELLHQNWAEVLLAKVPLSAWDEPSEYAFRVAPTKAASMRFLSRDTSLNESAKLLLDRRSALHGDLLEQMPAPMRLVYRPMLEWVEVPTDWQKFGELPLSHDTRFGIMLVVIEGLLRDQSHIYEQKFRDESQLPPTVPTPIAVCLKASESASQAVAAQIEQLCLTESDVSETIKESLLARTSANISVNRALLEYAAKDARGMEATEMCLPFLKRLNYHGLLEVPRELDDAIDGGASKTREWLTRMFAFGGLLAPVDDYFKRHMTESDIEMIVSWSAQLQETYITSRGLGGDWAHRGGLDEALKASRNEHGTPGHRFIFSLAMAAAFYETAQTAREFTGHSKPKYSVFPDRGDTAKGLRGTPPAHAGELLMQAYGQMYYANDGWELRADKLEAYSKMRSAKRSHIQQLLYFAVKNRSSRQLYALFQHLRPMPDSSAKK